MLTFQPLLTGLTARGRVLPPRSYLFHLLATRVLESASLERLGPVRARWLSRLPNECKHRIDEEPAGTHGSWSGESQHIAWPTLLLFAALF